MPLRLLVPFNLEIPCQSYEIHLHRDIIHRATMCSDSRSHDPDRTSTRVIDRRRHSNGKFAPAEGRTEQQTRSAILHIDRERRYLHSIKRTSDKVYERLLDAVFLPAGSRKLFVPSTSKRGPLRIMVKRLFKKKFIVAVNRQSFLTRVRFFNGASNRKAEHVYKMKIRDADDPSGKYIEKRVYKMRILP